MLTVIIFLLIIVVVAIWIFGEFKRSGHKFTIFLIILLLVFLVLSATFVFRSKPVDYQSVSGIFAAGKLYFVWLGTAFNNVKVVTSNAIHMDWTNVNQTASLNITKK